MRCKYKSSFYKSTLQFMNTTSQTISSTTSQLTLGSNVIGNTGVALNLNTDSISALYSGTYEITVKLTVNTTTTGNVIAQLYSNNVALPETMSITTLPTGYSEITLNTVRTLETSCSSPTNISVHIKSDGTAVGDVVNISGNMVKLA